MGRPQVSSSGGGGGGTEPRTSAKRWKQLVAMGHARRARACWPRCWAAPRKSSTTNNNNNNHGRTMGARATSAQAANGRKTKSVGTQLAPRRTSGNGRLIHAEGRRQRQFRRPAAAANAKPIGRQQRPSCGGATIATRATSITSNKWPNQSRRLRERSETLCMRRVATAWALLKRPDFAEGRARPRPMNFSLLH